jgi:outer membrane protein TolC
MTAPAAADLSRAQVKTAEASVAQAEAALDQANLNLSYTKITAVLGGTIASKTVEEGNYVQPGQTLFAIGAASLTGLSLIVAACEVGPNYVAPTRQVPANFNEAPANSPPNGGQPVDDAWWKILGDPALTGLESLYFTSFTSASSGYYQVGPGVTWRIFDAGRIRFQVKAEAARTDAAAAAYQRSVLEAFRDVETALVSYANTEVRRNELAAESAADRQATDIATLLYKKGVESFLPVLDAERSLYAAEDALALSERDSSLALISLYKALGGGWATVGPELSNNDVKPH